MFVSKAHVVYDTPTPLPPCHNLATGASEEVFLCLSLAYQI